jgi:hypothetical protein
LKWFFPGGFCAFARWSSILPPFPVQHNCSQLMRCVILCFREVM